MSHLDALLAALPILAVLVLMVFAKRSAATAGGAGLLVSVVLAAFAFDPSSPEVPGLWRPLLGAGAEAAFTAATILWIIFGALCVYHLQQKTGALARLREAIGSISDDPRIIAVLIAWFFALFAEGAAGFGTAVALAAPFLVGFGFKPTEAVVVTMIGHGIGVSFGAVGIPTLAQAQLVPLDAASLAGSAAVYHALLGVVMLFAMLRVVRRSPGEAEAEASEQAAARVWPWALLAAALYLGPMYFIAQTVGPELPTLGASLGGGLVFVGIYVWVQRHKRAGDPAAEQTASSPAEVARAAAPYLAIIVLVLLTRLIGPVNEALTAVTWDWTLWERFEGSFRPLFHPGTLLVVGFGIGALIQRAPLPMVVESVVESLRQIVPVTLALGAMLGLSRVMAHAGMIDVLAAWTAANTAAAWPFFAPWVGLLGTFVTGSATASNILFSEFAHATTTRLQMPPLDILGAQNAGAAVGSIVAPSKIVAGGATVGIAGQEGEILKGTLGPTLVYITLAGALAMVAVYLV